MLAGCLPLRSNRGAAETDHNVLTGGPVTGTRVKDLPLAVQATLRQRVPTAEVADIDKEKKAGRVVYKISFLEANKTPTMYITENGSVLESLSNPNP